MRIAFLVPGLISLALTCASCPAAGGQNNNVPSPFFLCPARAAVCIWADDRWEEVWAPAHGVARERLVVANSAPGLAMVYQASPYGALVSVMSGRQQIATAELRYPSTPNSALGYGGGVGYVCLGGEPSDLHCSIAFTPRFSRSLEAPSFPPRCLYPRSVGNHSFCVIEDNPQRRPEEPLKLQVIEESGDSERREFSPRLPSGFLKDFAVDGHIFAFLLEDGRVITGSPESLGEQPVVLDGLAFAGVSDHLLIVAGPATGESARLLLLVDSPPRTIELWHGDEIPMEVAQLKDGSILMRTESVTRDSAHLIRLQSVEAPTAKLLWSGQGSGKIGPPPK
jgi:hypothetical protein